MAIDIGIQFSRDIGPLQAAGGSSDLTETLSDSITFSDACTAQLAIAIILGDTVSFNEGIALLTFGYILNDGLSFSDDIDPSAPYNYTFSDVVQLADDMTLLIDPNQTMQFSDSIVFSDSLDILFIPFRVTFTFDDSVTLGDSLGIANQIPRTLNDFINLSDNLRLLSDFTNSFSDTLNLSDSPSINITNQPMFTDSYSLSDSISFALTAVLTLSLSDSISLSDSLDGVIPSTSFSAYLRRYLNDVPGSPNT